MAMRGVLEVMRQKDEIENKIADNFKILQVQNIGMQEPLVDAEGYPRQDIDIYKVRQARHNIICLQNDHKAVMKLIEEGLHTVHAQEKHRIPQKITEKMSTLESDASSTFLAAAFARISFVAADSPSAQAGLLVGDEVVEFGSVTQNNFTGIQNIANVVQHSIGLNVGVLVRRGTEIQHLNLVPQTWKGKGLLGCTITPMVTK